MNFSSGKSLKTIDCFYVSIYISDVSGLHCKLSAIYNPEVLLKRFIQDESGFLFFRKPAVNQVFLSISHSWKGKCFSFDVICLFRKYSYIFMKQSVRKRQ